MSKTLNKVFSIAMAFVLLLSGQGVSLAKEVSEAENESISIEQLSEETSDFVCHTEHENDTYQMNNAVKLEKDIDFVRRYSASWNVSGSTESLFEDASVRYGYDDLANCSNGEDRQKLYDYLYESAKNIYDTGNIRLYSDDSFSSYLFDKVDLSAYGLNASEAVETYFILRNDNPIFYYLGNDIFYTDKYIYVAVDADYALESVRKDYNNKITTAISEYEELAEGCADTYSKVKAVHDKICEGMYYSYNEYGVPSGEAWAHNIVGALVLGKGVCESYARSFELILNCIDIDNLYVTGMGGLERHAWNLVAIDGYYYWVDCTWDDSDIITYDYFLKGNDDWKDHEIELPTNAGWFFLYPLPENISDDNYSCYHAYIGIQTPAYSFRNDWYDSQYGLYGTDLLDGGYDVVYGWDKDDNLIVKEGKINDANITGNGTYTVSVTELGADEDFADGAPMNLIFVSTDIPNNGSYEITDIILKVNGKEVESVAAIDAYSPDYLKIICQHEFDVDYAGLCGAYELPVRDVSVTFTVSKKYVSKYKVNTMVEGEGRISVSPINAKAGKEVKLSVKANKGYRFKGWKTTDVTIKNNKFVMPAKDISIVAVFEKIPDNLYHAYMCFQTPAFSFRNEWTDKTYGLYGTQLLEGGYNVIYGWDENKNLIMKDGKINDADITGAGTYTVSATDLDLDEDFADGSPMNLIFVSTDIPNDGSFNVTNIKLKVNGKDVACIGKIDTASPDYIKILCQYEYNELKGACGTYEVPVKNVSVTFTLLEKTAEKYVETIILNKSTMTLEKGKSDALTATVMPADATNKKVTWTSSDTKVATVDANGKVTAVVKGSATITAMASDGSGIKATCTVTVTEPTTTTEPTTPTNPANPTTPSTPANTAKKLDAKNITLKSGTATYTGKAIKQAVTVKDGAKVLKDGTDYTVTYKNNKNVGTATVTISGKGGYTGTVTKTFKINPKKQTVKLTAIKKGFKVSCTKATKAEATGYEIRYATSKKALSKAKAVTVKSYKTAAKSISKLKAGKKYFVQVRTYKKIGKDTYYGAWSAAKSIKTKK